MTKDELFQSDWLGFDFIFFDCDSTLSTVEGIDELARQKGKFEAIKRLTDAAMEGEIHLESVYDRRLDLLRPTRSEIQAIAQTYQQTLVPDALPVIQALQAADKEIFIVSGGLLSAVRAFGEWLGIHHQNIRAVDVVYNELSGQWWDYEQDRWGQRPDVEYMDPEETPLIESLGKADVVQELLGDRVGRTVLIGDGMSDLAARPVVDLVIGFGGVVTRPRVAAETELFIKSASLAPVLPLVLSTQEQNLLPDTHKKTLSAGQAMIDKGEVVFTA
ncbi:MAG: HAD-IB family phosphatase [Chloroflexota bacterium]